MSETSPSPRAAPSHPTDGSAVALMRVLVATKDTQGNRPDDYCWTQDGELVRLPGMICDGPGCGCDRGFAGLTSSRATTTAIVVELALDPVGLRQAFVDTLRREKWLDPSEPPSWAEEWADEHAALAALLPVGSVVEVRGGEPQIRRWGSAPRSTP